MTWDVRWESRAADEMRRLARRDQSTARRIGQAVTRFAETGHGAVTELTGQDDEWRLRVGDWRVRFRFDRDAHAMVVTRDILR